MNYRPFLFLLFLLRASPLFAFGTDTLKIFYDIDKYDLSYGDKLRIRLLVDSLTEKDSIKVLGYADYLGHTDDNLELSGNRAESIKKYMLTLNSKLRIVTDWKGEVETKAKKSPDGEPISRRVDIIKLPKKQNIKLLVAAPVNKAGPVKPGLIPRKPALTRGDSIFNNKVYTIDKLDVGSSVSLEELTFQMGRHYLNPEARPYLNTLLQYLKYHTNIVFQIVGHVCCGHTDVDGYDQDTGEDKLSLNRAKAIYEYFLQKGIDANRMTYRGLGSTKPKVWPETSEHDEYLNRRVEIVILSK
jgi:outer membrane protein OmpA-like peptidoglycan-associated protein